MDTDVAGWILEFLLRQRSLDDSLLKVLIRSLPLPNNNPSLKKTLILRKIESDVEKGTISERTLEFFEQIEELDQREGNTEVSEAMKAAYCAVAVHCTAKFIEQSADDNKGKYVSAVRRIWRDRIREMEKFDVEKRVGLVSDDLSSWMDDTEAALCAVNFCKNILLKYKGLDVLEAVRNYVIEAKEKMGPSFLELVAETLSDDALRKIVGLGKDEELSDPIKDGEPVVAQNSSQDVDANANSKDNEMYKANVLRHKHITMRHPRGAGHGTHRGAKIVDPEASPDRYNVIPTPEANKIQEAFEASTSDLHAVVKDSLPDSLPLALSFRASIAGGNMAHDRGVGDHLVNASSASHDGNGEALQSKGDDLDVGVLRDDTEGPKTSLMERNSTAHTLEWSNSIDNSSSKGSPTGPHLPSPKKRAISPLKKDENKKLLKTRKKRRWSNVEEDTLRTGVLKYGKGSWKLILNMYRDIFVDRTEVDLKDKWRNLTR